MNATFLPTPAPLPPPEGKNNIIIATGVFLGSIALVALLVCIYKSCCRSRKREAKKMAVQDVELSRFPSTYSIEELWRRREQYEVMQIEGI